MDPKVLTYSSFEMTILVFYNFIILIKNKKYALENVLLKISALAATLVSTLSA